jgi:hypothetical protein
MNLEESNAQYQELKDFMSSQLQGNVTVEDWNAVRERAKKRFSREIISRMDGDSYIKKFL